MTVVYVFAGVWCLTAVAATAIIVYSIFKTRPERGQGAPRWAPDAPSAEDLELALEHDALIEDVEVAWLDSIWDLPTREPLR